MLNRPKPEADNVSQTNEYIEAWRDRLSNIDTMYKLKSDPAQEQNLKMLRSSLKHCEDQLDKWRARDADKDQLTRIVESFVKETQDPKYASMFEAFAKREAAATAKLHQSSTSTASQQADSGRSKIFQSGLTSLIGMFHSVRQKFTTKEDNVEKPKDTTQFRHK